MIEIEKIKDKRQAVVIINPDLDKYDDMAIFKEKNDKMFAFLEQNPLPAEWVKEIKDGRIKRYFEQNMPIEQIAQRVSMPKTSVLLALEEMGLIEPVIA